jgi:hypothetical protein
MLADTLKIDFAAVGHATSLKPPAARMRYTRLRRQIESGTLIGTHGTPFLSHHSSSTSPNFGHSEKLKRKRASRGGGEGEGKDEEECGFKGDSVGNVGKGVKAEKDELEGKKWKIKEEDEDDSTGWESGSGSDTEWGWDSEDEVPLAKLRKAKPGCSSVSQQTALVPSQRVVGGGRETREEGTNGANNGYGGRSVGGQRRVNGAAVPRYMPPSEGRAWEGMIPVGNVVIQNGYPAYWGNEYSSVGAWEQGGKPRKSV